MPHNQPKPYNMRWRKTKHRRARGVATVELAFVAPFVFFLIFASVEFARMMMVQQALTNAAREGCRKATLVTTTTDTQVASHVRDSLRGIVKNHEDPNVVDVEVTPTFSSAPEAGTKILVKVSVQAGEVSWFPMTIFSQVAISGQATMERE